MPPHTRTFVKVVCSSFFRRKKHVHWRSTKSTPSCRMWYHVRHSSVSHLFHVSVLFRQAANGPRQQWGAQETILATKNHIYGCSRLSCSRQVTTARFQARSKSARPEAPYQVGSLLCLSRPPSGSLFEIDSQRFKHWLSSQHTMLVDVIERPAVTFRGFSSGSSCAGIQRTRTHFLHSSVLLHARPNSTRERLPEATHTGALHILFHPSNAPGQGQPLVGARDWLFLEARMRERESTTCHQEHFAADPYFGRCNDSNDSRCQALLSHSGRRFADVSR